jgi:hypothetical protein
MTNSGILMGAIGRYLGQALAVVAVIAVAVVIWAIWLPASHPVLDRIGLLGAARARGASARARDRRQ